MSARGIPQLSVVMGSCTAGGTIFCLYVGIDSHSFISCRWRLHPLHVRPKHVCMNVYKNIIDLPSCCLHLSMVDKHGFVFLGGPPLVKAATGEVPFAQNLFDLII